MDLKSETEIKEEELDLEYNSYEHCSQILPDSGTDFKIKEFDEIYIKSELREIEEESMLDKEQDNATPPEMIGKMSSHLHGEDWRTFLARKIKSLVGVADQGEQFSKLKSSESKPLTSGTFDQSIKGNCQDYLRCRFCNFIFKYKYELMSHLKTHDKKEFKCAHCSFECKRKDNLKSHLLIHSNLKLFKCSECSYENNHKSNLKIHQLTHSKLKLFKCCKCGTEFSSTGNLKRHMVTHNNLKLFKCTECSYECNRKSDFKIHVLNHSNLKLFKCSECSYECNHKGTLKTHMLI